MIHHDETAGQGSNIYKLLVVPVLDDYGAVHGRKLGTSDDPRVFVRAIHAPVVFQL